jgi:uncharacterized protein (DUF1330 family)
MKVDVGGMASDKTLGPAVARNSMKTQCTIALSVIAGLALGAITIQILHAQAKPMGYSIALNTVNDQERYSKEFAPSIAKTIQDAGGKFLVRGGKTVAMHGAPPAPRIVVVQFESMDKAQAWANAEATKAAFAIGEKYSTLNDFLVEGSSP